MKVLVVGAGKVGSTIARDLATSAEVDSVKVADASRENLRQLKTSKSRIHTVRLDVAQDRKLVDEVRKVDLVCGALPGRLGFGLLTEVVRLRCDIVDISYTPEDPFKLDALARQNDRVVVPQCGVAPGLSNMCVGDAARQLGNLSSVRIYVGGLPKRPVPPLNYRIVFSLEDVINEYSRPVNVIMNGRKKQVEPLTGRGMLNFPGVGRLEYFLTDGLGSLPRTFPGVREMYELTLRYPGHAAMMETLRILGFFGQDNLSVNGSPVQPRRVSLELLKPLMSQGSPEDLLALKADIVGSGKNPRILTYKILDFYDGKQHVSAMSRTTAYPCTSVALLVGTGKLRMKGVVPPEKIAQDKTLFDYIVSYIRERGVRLRTSVSRHRLRH